MLALLAASPARAQVLPNPDLLVPFAPITYNGPLAGNAGIFAFGSFNIGPVGLGVTINVLDGNVGAQVPFPATFPAMPPYTVSGANAATLTAMRLHNGLGPPGVDPAEDDNPQALGGGAGGRTLHHRRHRLVPTNQDIVAWRVTNEDTSERLIFSTVVKLDPSVVILPLVQQGGVLSIDYMSFLIPGPPPIVNSVWPTAGAAAAVGGAPANATFYVPVPAPSQLQVLSDLSPNVYGPTNPAAPNSLAWVTGAQDTGDTPPPPPAAPAPGLLVVSDHSVPGGPPAVASTLLQSPYSPFAEKLLVWNNISGTAGLLPQYILVPCRGGVEIYDPTLVGSGGELIKVVPTAPDKEICSNISFFGPSPYDDTPPTPYFIVLERNIGEMQPAGGGVNFIVFDLLTGSIAARGPVGASGTMPGLESNYGRPQLDVVRGCNDIAVAPPERDAPGNWNPSPSFAATAWFGVWDANAAVTATPAAPAALFGGLVGVENWGLANYADGGFGLNAAGPFPAGTNVRYFTPARDASGAMFTAEYPPLEEVSFPVPVGEVSTNPIFNPLPNQGIVNQNLITWYWDNGLFGSPDPILNRGTGFGVAVLDVTATWRSTNPAYPGGITIDGSGNGSYPAYVDRSQETITERPLFGYINYPVASIIFAQRQVGIETLGALLIPTSPRPILAMAPFPQTPAPVIQPSQVQWTYQKRRHTAWNPPSASHPLINSSPGSPGFPFAFGLDTAITIEATETWDEFLSPQPGIDDWVSYFVNWRPSIMFGLFPSAQGTTYWDWASPRAGQNLLPLGAGDATTAPPPTSWDASTGALMGFPYYSASGQTPLWADWFGAGSLLYPGMDLRPVLRSHSNPFPILGPADNNAWVGIGGQQMLKYSLGENLLASSQTTATWPTGKQVFPQAVLEGFPYPLGAPGEMSIIAAHIDQVGAGAGTSPAIGGGPGQFRINFLHIQANPAASAGPGYEATYVNNPLGTDWQVLLPVGEIVSTEILAVYFQ